jgi:hypothetical protein
MTPTWIRRLFTRPVRRPATVRNNPARSRLSFELMEDRVVPAISGAIYTTDGSAGGVDLNLYDDKADVYLNGGPQNLNGAGLDVGTYYFQVTGPAGNGPQETLLSTDLAIFRQLKVVEINGKGRVAGADIAAIRADLEAEFLSDSGSLTTGGTITIGGVTIVVADGVPTTITGSPVTTAPAGTTAGTVSDELDAIVAACAHINGLPNSSNGSIAVQLGTPTTGHPEDPEYFADTPNAGGVYKVYVIKKAGATINGDGLSIDFSQNNVKTDNFRLDTPNQPLTSTITGYKFYDANTDGDYDGVSNGEGKIPGWTINLYADLDNDGEIDDGEFLDTTTTGADGNYSFDDLGDGDYLVCESTTPPAGFAAFTHQGWLPTTDVCQDVTLPGQLHAATAIFGNVELGAGGGLTLGFWSNKNGKVAMGGTTAAMTATLAFLDGLNLVGANGQPAGAGGTNLTGFDDYTEFRTWILNATATNMAYMLSAQLAAMELNVRQGFVSGNSLIYAPGTASANLAGFATVNAVMAEADASLLDNTYTVAAGTIRSSQESLKNALDNGNNNLNFVLGWHDLDNDGFVDPGEIY